MFLCAAVLEAMQRWRTEKESRLSGEKQEEEEEEESIYTIHHEEVNFTFQELMSQTVCRLGGASFQTVCGLWVELRV